MGAAAVGFVGAGRRMPMRAAAAVAGVASRSLGRVRQNALREVDGLEARCATLNTGGARLVVFRDMIKDGCDNYRCFNFFFNRLAGAVDSIARAGKSDFSLRVVLVKLGRDVNSTTCRRLHFLDCLSTYVFILVSLWFRESSAIVITFPYNHPHRINWHLDSLTQSAIPTSSSSSPIMTPTSPAPASTPTSTVVSAPSTLRWPSLWSPWSNTWWWPRACVIALNNLHDEPFCVFGGRNGADEVYGSLAVLALGFADDVDVTARLVLDVADRFAAAANDEANGAVGDKYLDRILCETLVTFNINPKPYATKNIP